MVELADGSSIPMSDVTAGDYVLPGPTRVIVNQARTLIASFMFLLPAPHATSGRTVN